MKKNLLFTLLILSVTSVMIVAAIVGTQQDENSTNRISSQEDNQPVFSLDTGKIIHLFPILKNKKAYYLKNGDIWMMDFSNSGSRPRLFVDVEKDVLAFDISNDGKVLAYSLRKVDLRRSDSDPLIEDESFEGPAGDTLMIRNLYDSTEYELYSDRKRENFQIRSILFSPDGKQLFFSTNYLWKADVATRKVKKYDADELKSCGVYFLEEFSYDGLHILVQNGCIEGSYRIIFNVVAAKVTGRFENGYAGFFVIGFLTDDSLLAYDGKIGMYSLRGKLIQQIGESDSYPLFFDNKSDPDKVFISLSSRRSDSNSQSFYELNKSTLAIREFKEKRTIAVVLCEAGDAKKSCDLWLTNNALEEPVFFDSLVLLPFTDPWEKPLYFKVH